MCAYACVLSLPPKLWYSSLPSLQHVSFSCACSLILFKVLVSTRILDVSENIVRGSATHESRFYRECFTWLVMKTYVQEM